MLKLAALLLMGTGLMSALGIGIYQQFFHAPTVVDDVAAVKDDHAALPQTDEFEHLAQTDPVAMLERCLVRYQREITGGVRCILEKEERIKGELRPQEKISLCVRGDVPDAGTTNTHIEVLMKWQEGAQKVMGSKVEGILYREDKDKDSMLTWRPSAFIREFKVGVKSGSAKDASRYCIRDAGIYRGMLRTYDAWKERKEAGTLATEYLGRRVVPQADGAECLMVKRNCRTPEVDPFALEANAKGDDSPKAIADEGFTEVTIMVDAKRWLQVGTELRRANGELMGAYYFNHIELNPNFDPATFDDGKNGLLKK